MKHLKTFENFQNWDNLTNTGDWDKNIKIILPEQADESYIKRKLVNIVIVNKLLKHDDIVKSIKSYTGLFDPIVTIPMSGTTFVAKNEYEKVKKVSDKLNLTSVRMPSGAGHDAQEMALIAPTGMIFIPSKNGISHSAAEYSTISQVQNGYLTLLHSILAIDKLDSLD